MASTYNILKKNQIITNDYLFNNVHTCYDVSDVLEQINIYKRIENKYITSLLNVYKNIYDNVGKIHLPSFEKLTYYCPPNQIEKVSTLVVSLFQTLSYYIRRFDNVTWAIDTNRIYAMNKNGAGNDGEFITEVDIDKVTDEDKHDVIIRIFNLFNGLSTIDAKYYTRNYEVCDGCDSCDYKEMETHYECTHFNTHNCAFLNIKRNEHYRDYSPKQVVDSYIDPAIYDGSTCEDKIPAIIDPTLEGDYGYHYESQLDTIPEAMSSDGSSYQDGSS